MIQKEQIQQRRQKIAELRHADTVYREIVDREKEREKHEKRWFWELLQNAKDSVEENQKIKVKVEITDDEVSFSHTGNPFNLDDILSLILQGSSKNDQEGKTGRFGTGFITTYLLSKEVYITGKLSNDQGCFHFLLNRNAENNEQFYTLQEDSNKQFEESIDNNSYLANSEFQTKFSYKLDNNGKKTVKIGLMNIYELIPITLLFNDQIDTVAIIDNEKTKTFSKSLIQSYKEWSINEWQINTIVEEDTVLSIRAYIHKNDKYDACIITKILNERETIYHLTNNYPRLYYTFPLIGTEEIGIPVIINSTHFDPKVERDGIYLNISENENVENNKNIMNTALQNSINSFVELFMEKNINGIHEMFGFNSVKELEWIDKTWFTSSKKDAVDLLSAKEIIKYDNLSNSCACLHDLHIPFTDKEENLKELWELLSEIRDIKVPLSCELSNWIEITNNIAQLKNISICDLPFVFDIDKLISQYVENKTSLMELENVIKIDVHDWLNKLYALIIKEKGSFSLDKNIALNQRGKFIKAEDINWDKCNDDDLLSISDLVGLNFADKLFSRKINHEHNIHGVQNFNLDDAKDKLLIKLNDLAEKDINDNLAYQKCNANFLKWLISKNDKETIKNLTIISGVSESFSYGHFPETDPLLLTPKAYFKNDFPLYANLVRDKDCLSDVYNEYLFEEDYKFLNDNDFVYLKPLVVRCAEATIRLLKDLNINENELGQLVGSDGELRKEFKITFSDFAYLTANEGHIYDRNSTQKSSIERLKFFLAEAVEKDVFLNTDTQKIEIKGIYNPIELSKCLWVYRAKRLNWVYIKNDAENSEKKFSNETPSSKNLSELLKGDDNLTKTIRGEKQQLFLKKLGVSVSDLIRNTLLSDEESESWDKAITSMITSDIDPELALEIFNDRNIRNEYEKRKRERELINRNQLIGKLVEDLFREYIEEMKKNGIPVNIKREPFGSDYILTEESSDLVNNENAYEGFRINDWLVELKATSGEFAAMTQLQAKTAKDNKERYALIVVPLDKTKSDIDYIKKNAKVVTNIGVKIDAIYTDFDEVETKKIRLNNGKDGISVNIEDHNIRFKVSSVIWNAQQLNIENFIQQCFHVHKNA